MAAIVTRNQPRSVVRLDRQNRLTRGAQAVVTATSPLNLASGKPLTIAGLTTADRNGTPAGIANKFRKNHYLQTESLPAIGTATFVEFWHGYLTTDVGSAGGTTEAGFLTGQNVNQLGIFRNWRAGGTSWGSIWDWAQGVDLAPNLANEVLSAGVLTTLVAVRRGAATELWRNGRLINTVTQMGAVAYPAGTFITGSFVEDIGFWSSSSDTILAGRIVNDWSADDVKSFCGNPWQLLDAPERRILVAASAPAGGATASPPGVSVASGVGTATASGAANRTVSGVSATSAIGTATASGSTTVNATATPAGVFATASVGTATASGATVVHGNAPPAGVSATGTVGTAAASGQAAINATGVSATASVGTAAATAGAVVHGTATPAGVSATASRGTATVSASANAVPPGVSVLATIGAPIATGQIFVSATALPAGVLAHASVGTAVASDGAVPVYARAPRGAGYAPQRSNVSTRPTSGPSSRPSNVQRNNR